MKKTFEIVKYNPLWNGIGYNDFEQMFHCIEARTQSFEKGDIVLLSGDSVNSIGMIISGSVKVIKEDMEGNITILTELGVSELFGEVFACAGIEHSPVTVQAADACEIMFFNYKKVVASCTQACQFHSRLVENMLMLIAKKTLLLNQKIEILSQRTTREKLLLFFDIERGMAKKFTIPYNREELAHYLCVDRSAMSNELCKMRDEGLIKFRKNEFEML